MKAVFYTFYNSKCDIDYSIYSKDYPVLIVFYCYKAPENLSGVGLLINLNSQLELFNNSDFVLSRMVKFQPWRFMDEEFENYIYFDYRIKLSKKFIDYTLELNGTYFFRHREGGVLKNELLRVISRDKRNTERLVVYLSKFHDKLDAPITEN